MLEYIIAHEGKLNHAAIVTAQSELHAIVKYYETARTCGQAIGEKGYKCFGIAKISNSDGMPELKEGTMFHHADLDGKSWLEDVEPIDNWAKYGHAGYTSH